MCVRAACVCDYTRARARAHTHSLTRARSFRVFTSAAHLRVHTATHMRDRRIAAEEEDPGVQTHPAHHLVDSSRFRRPPPRKRKPTKSARKEGLSGGGGGEGNAASALAVRMNDEEASSEGQGYEQGQAQVQGQGRVALEVRKVRKRARTAKKPNNPFTNGRHAALRQRPYMTLQFTCSQFCGGSGFCRIFLISA